MIGSSFKAGDIPVGRFPSKSTDEDILLAAASSFLERNILVAHTKQNSELITERVGGPW